MTRINAGISVINLTDQHLLAEHREITRIPNLIKGRDITNIPESFRLGTGHVKFFYNKIGYLFNRYKELYRECIARGFDVEDKSSAFTGHDLSDWLPTAECYNLLVERISKRIIDSKQIPRYYGEKITKDDAISNLKR
jgi:hypothetical protein